MGDIVVIGGGVAGTSAAYQLAREGATVTLIDRSDRGQATAAGAGIIAPDVDLRNDPDFAPLVRAAADFYPVLLKRLAADGEGNTGFATPGELFVALSSGEAERLPEVAQVARERVAAGWEGIGEVCQVSDAEARAAFPPLSSTYGAVWISGSSRVDGRLLRDALRRAAQTHGATVIKGDARPVRKGDRVIGVEVDGRVVPSEVVIVAGGAWSSDLGAAVRIDLPVYPQRGQIIHLGMPGAETTGWPVITGFHSHYMLAFPPNRVVVGATREDEAGFDDRVTAGGVHEVLGEALRVAPGLADGSVEEIRVGLRPASPDRRPVLGRVSDLANVYLATGFGPSGLQLGPYCGAVVADLARGHDVAIDLAPFGVERFAHHPSGTDEP